MITTHNNGHGSTHRLTNLIMLIEDNMDHAELVIRTTKEHPIPNEVRHFPDGRSAFDYLFRRNSFSDPVSSPRPQTDRGPNERNLEMILQVFRQYSGQGINIKWVQIRKNSTRKPIDRLLELY